MYNQEVVISVILVTSSSFSLAKMNGVEEETMVQEDDIQDRNLALFSMALFRVSMGLLSTLTLFIFLFLTGSSVVGRGVVVVVFIVGRTRRSVICFVLRRLCWSSTLPPQFLTQFSPVIKLFPLPPQPLNLQLFG